MLFIWAVLFSDLVMRLQYELTGGHGLKKPMSWATRMEQSEKQKSGKKAVVAETEEEKFLSILCTKTHANPGYLFTKSGGLSSLQKQKDEKVFATTMESKPQKRVRTEHWKYTHDLMEVSLEEVYFKVSLWERKVSTM